MLSSIPLFLHKLSNSPIIHSPSPNLLIHIILRVNFMLSSIPLFLHKLSNSPIIHSPSPNLCFNSVSISSSAGIMDPKYLNLPNSSSFSNPNLSLRSSHSLQKLNFNTNLFHINLQFHLTHLSKLIYSSSR